MTNYIARPINPDELDCLSARHPEGNFQQSSSMGTLRQENGIEVEYLGLFDGDQLVAAALLETHHARLSTFCAVHDGPLCDFHNARMTRALMAGLRKRAKENGATQLEITPEFIYRIRDSFGNELPADQGGSPDDESIDLLKSLGFEHGGFTTGYTAIPRWRYVKDVSKFKNDKDLLSSYGKSRRYNIHLAQASSITIDKIDYDHLDDFYHLCELSADRQGFDNRSKSYFEKFYNAFGDRAEFLVAYIDLNAYINSWENKDAAYQKDIRRLEASLATSRNPEKVLRKIDNLKKSHEGALRHIKEARAHIDQDGPRPPITCGLFVWHEREVVYLFSGSDNRYTFYCAPSLLQHYVMCQCIKRHVGRYNFYGINGVFDDPKDPGRGVLEFKQLFCGHVEELPGEFTLIIRPGAYHVKQLAHKLLRH